MNVGIVKTQVPFVRDEIDGTAEALVQAVLERGHAAELIRVPFRSQPPQRVLEHLLAIRLLRLPNVERVVALGFPAYCVAHSHKLVWSLENPAFVVDDTPEGRAIGVAIAAARARHLAEARHVFGGEDSAATVAEAVLS